MAINVLPSSALVKILRKILGATVVDLQSRLKLQGHVNSGSLLKSIQFTINLSRGEIVGQITFNAYGRFVDQGVKAVNIPYSGRSDGSSSTASEYIQGLKDFFEDKGLSDIESLRAAFATANVHSREGMPTRASGRFSSDVGGSRVGFVALTIREKRDSITFALREVVSEEVELTINALFNKPTLPIELALL